LPVSICKMRCEGGSSCVVSGLDIFGSPLDLTSYPSYPIKPGVT
jgi:hypothetical protein